jgi:hypothetical protein
MAPDSGRRADLDQALALPVPALDQQRLPAHVAIPQDLG